MPVFLLVRLTAERGDVATRLSFARESILSLNVGLLIERIFVSQEEEAEVVHSFSPVPAWFGCRCGHICDGDAFANSMLVFTHMLSDIFAMTTDAITWKHLKRVLVTNQLKKSHVSDDMVQLSACNRFSSFSFTLSRHSLSRTL